MLGELDLLLLRLLSMLLVVMVSFDATEAVSEIISLSSSD